MRGLKIFSYVVMIFFAANIFSCKVAHAGGGGAIARVVGRAVVGITTTALRSAGKFVVRTSISAVRGAGKFIVRTSVSAVRGAGKFVVKTSIKAGNLAKREVENMIIDKVLDAATPDLKLADKVTKNVSRVMNLAKEKIPDDVAENAGRAITFAKEKIPDDVAENAGRAITFAMDKISDATNYIDFSEDKNLEVK